MNSYLCVLLLACSILLVNGDNDPCGEDCSWSITDGTLSITGTGAMSDYSQTQLPPWYDDKDSITTVEIDGVESVGAFAFYGFDAIEEFTAAADSIKSIDVYAFYGCSAMRKVTLPASLTAIHANAFNGCLSMEEFDVDAENTKFSSADGVLFQKRTSGLALYMYPPAKDATTYEIPAEAVSIIFNGFRYASKLTSIKIHKDLDSISPGSFIGTSSLEEFIVAQDSPYYYSDTKALVYKKGIVSKYLFRYPPAADGDSYTIPDGTSDIDESAFEDSELKSITFPSSVKIVNDRAFKNCADLEEVELPAALTSVASNAFDGCTSLKSIVLKGTSANCKSVNGVLVCGTAIAKYPAKLADKEYTVPKDTKYIYSLAFENVTGLETISIPETVDSIAANSFIGCKKLKNIKYEGLSDPGKSGAFVDCPVEDVCVKKAYDKTTFCGFSKLSHCFTEPESSSTPPPSTKSDSSSMVLPSFAVLAVIMAFFARFF